MKKRFTEEEFEQDRLIKEYIQEERNQKCNEDQYWTISKDKSPLVFSLKKILSFISFIVLIFVIFLIIYWFDYIWCKHYVTMHCNYYKSPKDNEICNVKCDFKTVWDKSWEKY